ncbi:unnamed protein product [Caenorhabditis brenneri]
MSTLPKLTKEEKKVYDENRAKIDADIAEILKANPVHDHAKGPTIKCPCHPCTCNTEVKKDAKTLKREMLELLDLEQLKPAFPNGISAETQRKIDEMMKTIPVHEDVYPPAPTPDQIAIPTGRWVTCICSPDCTKELPQPAYHIIRDENEDKRWDINSMTRREFIAMAQASKLIKKRK